MDGDKVGLEKRMFERLVRGPAAGVLGGGVLETQQGQGRLPQVEQGANEDRGGREAPLTGGHRVHRGRNGTHYSGQGNQRN